MRRELAVLAAAFVITLPLITPRIYASDEVQYFAYLRSLWFDHDVSFENEYQHFWDAGVARSQGFHETYLERQTETGRRISFATIGAAILWSPFYAVADALVAHGHWQAATFATATGRAYVRAVASARRSTAGSRSCWAGDGAPPRPGPRRPRRRARRLVRHAADLLHVRRAADGARLLGVRGRRCSSVVWLHVRERWSIGGGVALGATRRADGDGARAGSASRVGRRSMGAGVGAGAGGTPLGAPATAPCVRTRGRGSRRFASCYAPQLWPTSGPQRPSGPSRLVVRKMNWFAPHALQRPLLARARAPVLDAACDACHHRPRRA